VQISSEIVATNKPTSSFSQAGCPSCHPTDSVKALMASALKPSDARTLTFLSVRRANSSQNVTIHKSTPSFFLQAGCPSCHPTNSVKALKGKTPFVHSISRNYLLSHLSASDFSTADFTASQTQSTLSADVVDLTESMLPADRADQARLDPLMYIVCVTSSLLQQTEQQENVADQ